MKRVIDERQERDLYVIEHYGFWIAFYGLLGIILYQTMFKDLFYSFIFEIILFITLSLIIIIGCIKKEIWHPYAKASQREYVSAAIITFISVFIVYLLILITRNTIITLSLIGNAVLLGLGGSSIVYILSYFLGKYIIKRE